MNTRNFNGTLSDAGERLVTLAQVANLPASNKVLFLFDMELITIKTSDVLFRKDLYPRIEHNQQKAQEYSENIEQLPPIQLNQHYELIDGFHRWTAHKLAGVETIKALITETKSDMHLLELAIRTNATHGLQMSQSDKRKMAIRMYSVGERNADRKNDLAEMLSVSFKSISRWVSDLDQAEREERKAVIVDMWHKCYSNGEIAESIGTTEQPVKDALSDFLKDVSKNPKVTFSEPEFTPPLYNVWTFAKKTNDVSHFGNTEQRIVDNLLYLFTEPQDIVVDPFGGGGATLDLCKQRMRRCWISDRNPKAGMEDKIRLMDIAKELPNLHKRWSDVSLTYLDPPYWKQAEGQYSDSPDDLANMSLQDFTEAMVGIVRRISEKQSKGAIALIIQPTQWKAEGRMFTDHVFDICKGVEKAKSIRLWNRISCPYSTEQCTPQMVNWAKENKQVLVLSRELIVWSYE